MTAVINRPRPSTRSSLNSKSKTVRPSAVGRKVVKARRGIKRARAISTARKAVLAKANTKAEAKIKSSGRGKAHKFSFPANLPIISSIGSRRARRVAQLETAPTPKSAAYLLLTAIIGTLTIIGLAMVLSASSVQSLRSYGSSWYFFERQLVWLAIGSVVLIGFARFDYRKLQNAGTPLLVLCGAALCLVLIPGVGVSVYGSSRWLGWGALSVQPSEFAKLALLLFVADLGAKRADRAEDFRSFAKPALFVAAIFGGLVMLQPDLSTALVMGVLVFVILYVGNARASMLAGITVGGVMLAGASIIVSPYRWQRLLTFLHPMRDTQGAGYQTLQSLIGLSDGGMLGLGVGGSRAKWGFLPQAHTDFIFTIIGEELGFVGSLGVLALFAAIAVLATRVALRAPDRFGTLLAAGITAWILTEATFNIGGALGVLPVTGTPLPFMSSGGSSLVVMMCGFGILLNIARAERAPVTRKTTVRNGSGRKPAAKKLVGARA